MLCNSDLPLDKKTRAMKSLPHPVVTMGHDAVVTRCSEIALTLHGGRGASNGVNSH